MADNNTDAARRRLILALDVPNVAAAKELLDRIEGEVGVVKVGLELFTACGPAAVEEVTRRGMDVFLDLKLHDIPHTVAGAVRAAGGLGVSMLTVHTGGGKTMLQAAAEAAGDTVRVLGVTLLTSMGKEDLEPVGMCGEPESVVLKRASLAAEAGLGGIVCSPREIVRVREVLPPGMAVVTPGIRPSGSAMGDQKRAATPESAISDGADYLVVGRPISGAPDPAKAASDIVAAIDAALRTR